MTRSVGRSGRRWVLVRAALIAAVAICAAAVDRLAGPDPEVSLWRVEVLGMLCVLSTWSIVLEVWAKRLSPSSMLKFGFAVAVPPAVAVLSWAWLEGAGEALLSWGLAVFGVGVGLWRLPTVAAVSPGDLLNSALCTAAAGLGWALVFVLVDDGPTAWAGLGYIAFAFLTYHGVTALRDRFFHAASVP